MKIKKGWARRGILLLSTVTLLFTACNDESGLGYDIIPAGDQALIVVDSLRSFKAYTIQKERIQCDEDINNSARDFNLVGSYVDPVFGGTNVGFLTQVRLSKNEVNLGDNLDIDSLILYMRIKGHYADSSQTNRQQFKVYQLSDTIAADTDYYSDIEIENYYDENELLWQQTYFASNDSVMAVKIDFEPFIEILKDTNNLVDNEIFTQVLKGFYVKVDQAEAGGAITSFDLLDDASRLTLYYRNSDDGSGIEPVSKLKSFDFLINDNCARINVFTHDREMATDPIVGLNDTVNDNDLMYIQGLGGAEIQLEFKNLLTWKDSVNYVVTRAELIIPVLEGSASEFAPPPNLALTYRFDDELLHLLPDQSHNGSTFTDYFGGY